MANKSAKGAVAYAKAQLGKPYWFGTYGQVATRQLYDNKKKQYPSYYTANDFTSQYGKRVHDCIGLAVKGYLWSDTPYTTPKYNSSQDTNAQGMYNISKEKGKIKDIPKEDGILVYKGTNASTKKIHHIGIYSATENCVYEAKGHAYGVVKSSLSDGWHFWSRCPWLDYTNQTETKKEVGNIYYSAQSFDSKIAGTYKTTSDLNMRVGAGTTKAVVKVLKNKTRVRNYGYYTTVSGTKWYLVETDDKVIGYCSSVYLRKV